MATTAMVVVLSVFNGFSDLVATLFISFDPQIELRPSVGKTFSADDPLVEKVRSLDMIDVVSECVEGQALAIYGD